MRKVIVLNPDVYQKLKERTNGSIEMKNSINENIEQELEEILKSDKHPEEKRILYLQALYKLLQGKTGPDTPLEIPIIEKKDEHDTYNLPKSVHAENDIMARSETDFIKREKLNNSIIYDDDDEAESTIKNEILRVIPTSRKKIGLKLYNLMKEYPTVRWDKNGTVYVDEAKVNNSNIIAILNDLLRKHKQEPPVGWFKILPKLKMMNIPKGIIHNKKRIKDIYGDDSQTLANDRLSKRQRVTSSRIKKHRTRENNQTRWEPY